MGRILFQAVEKAGGFFDSLKACLSAGFFRIKSLNAAILPNRHRCCLAGRSPAPAGLCKISRAS